MQALPVHNTSPVWSVRRDYTRQIKQEDAQSTIDLAHELIDTVPPLRWFAYELVRYHKAAFHSIDAVKLEALMALTVGIPLIALPAPCLVLRGSKIGWPI